MHAMCNDDPLEDHHSLSSYDLLVHEISDQKKRKTTKLLKILLPHLVIPLKIMHALLSRKNKIMVKRYTCMKTRL